MGKTTIDGLAVRTSSSSRRAAAGSGKPARSMELAPRRRASAASAKKSTSNPNAVAPLKKRSDDELLDFGWEDKTHDDLHRSMETLGEDTGADWSDLLGELSESKTSARATGVADFLADDELSEDPKNDGKASAGSWLDEWADENDYDSKTKKTHRHKKHFGRYATLAVVAILLIGAGIFYKWGDSLISRLTGGNSGLFDAFKAMVSDEIPFEKDVNGRTNVLVFGTEGYNMNGDSGNGRHDGAQLTDSIMVVSFDQETKDVALLSLPRDLKVSMACSAGKVNEVFWCHNQNGDNEEAGAKALMQQIGSVLGLDFQYYAHVNWASLIDIIDTLGGITVTLDEDINDVYYTGAVARAGEPLTVNGEQALGLARARHGTAGGDFTRGNTQQKIVEAIADKLIHNGVGMSEALGLVNILGDNLRSNFSADNIKAAVRLASGFSISSIRQVPLVDYSQGLTYFTTATINEISYVVPTSGSNDYSQIQAYIAQMLSTNQIVRENANITVYNATDGYGLANNESAALERDGYNILGIGNADIDDCTESYCVYALNPEKTATKAALEERYGAQARTAGELPDGIPIDGSDFIILIGLAHVEEA